MDNGPKFFFDVPNISISAIYVPELFDLVLEHWILDVF